jgi:simple sugar transport system permease protein
MDLKRFGFIAFIIVILFVIVVLVGKGTVPATVIIVSMVATTISVSTPLVLGALSGVFCERSGIVNIGIEGMMLSSAFFGWFASIYLSFILKAPALTSLLFGVVVAILTGGLMGLLLAWLSVTFKVDQIIGGTVINILAIGITGFLNRQIFFEKHSVFGGQVPHAPGTLPPIHIPFLADIPLFGKSSFSSRLPSPPLSLSSWQILLSSILAGGCARALSVNIHALRIPSASMYTRCSILM